ncbi:MAG: hypothetical protein WAJ92_01700 [Candidatus Acidiferrales bacterium]
MANANRQQLSAARWQAAAGVFAAAILLILVGIVFQLGEIGYGHFSAQNLWVLSTLATTVWHVAAARLNGPGVHDLAQFWPLLPVVLGFSIFAVAGSVGRLLAGGSPGQGQSHGE